MALASANCEGNALIGMTQGAGGTYTGACSFFGLNTATTGTSGANEISGGSPAYIRVSNAFGSPSAGSVANTGALTLNVPATTTVAYGSEWGAVSGTGTGGFQIGMALNASITFNTQGTLTVAIGGLTLGAS